MSSKIWANPVITSEMKIRMRGWRTALGIAAYLGVLLLIGFLYYLAFVQQTLGWDSSVNARQTAGMEIYMMLASIQFSLILLITPAQTAGTISGEREKQTLDLLLSTKMSPFSIIFGKLISSMSFIILLIVTSIPLFSLIFLFGGVTPGDMAKLFLFYIITAFAVGSIGIFFSTLFKRTIMSTVVTYLTIFLLGLVSVILGVYMLSVQLSGISPHPTNPAIPFVLYINPAVGLTDILVTEPGGIRALFGIYLGTQGGVDFWIINSVVMIVIAILLLKVSVNKINPVRHRRRKKVKGMG
ncbi:MAG TPA: ABC transporter permease [Clostridiales bacterium]|nr:ABC transporter permease [Clostridiales bacterium]